MKQTVLFPAESRPQRRRAAAVSALPRERVVFLAQSVHEQALRQDATLRGTGHAREQRFRETLWQWCMDYNAMVPAPLFALVRDHATRTDMSGHSLCFNGPLRQVMLAEVAQWLATVEEPAARMRWQALAASQQSVQGGTS